MCIFCIPMLWSKTANYCGFALRTSKTSWCFPWRFSWLYANCVLNFVMLSRCVANCGMPQELSNSCDHKKHHENSFIQRSSGHGTAWKCMWYPRVAREHPGNCWRKLRTAGCHRLMRSGKVGEKMSSSSSSHENGHTLWYLCLAHVQTLSDKASGTASWALRYVRQMF